MLAIRILLIIAASIVFSQDVKAQSPNQNISKMVSTIISDKLLENMGDSTAVYGSTLFINVKKGQKHEENIIQFSISNPEVESFFGNLEPLQKIDYSQILGKRDSIVLFYKIYILVISSKYGTHPVDIEAVDDMLKRTSFKGETEMINLGTTMFKIDKKMSH